MTVLKFSAIFIHTLKAERERIRLEAKRLQEEEEARIREAALEAEREAARREKERLETEERERVHREEEVIF